MDIDDNFVQNEELDTIKFDNDDPTDDNISESFAKVLYNLICAINYDCYSEDKTNFQLVLQDINKFLKIYVNTGSLINVDYKDVLEVYYMLLDLKNKYMEEKGWYAERLFSWYFRLMLLRKKEIEIKEEEYGKR